MKEDKNIKNIQKPFLPYSFKIDTTTCATVGRIHSLCEWTTAKRWGHKDFCLCSIPVKDNNITVAWRNEADVVVTTAQCKLLNFIHKVHRNDLPLSPKIVRYQMFVVHLMKHLELLTWWNAEVWRTDSTHMQGRICVIVEIGSIHKLRQHCTV